MKKNIRIKYDTSCRQHLPEASGVTLKHRSTPIKIKKGDTLTVQEVDEETKEVKAFYPIDPSRILIIAQEAVEFYDEAKGIWQDIKALFANISEWFRVRFSRKKR